MPRLKSNTISIFRTTLFCFCLIFVLSTTQARAWCIYNKSSHEVAVHHVKNGNGSKFYLMAGQHRCCPWTVNTCNSTNSKTGRVAFNISITGLRTGYYSLLPGIEIDAGGWIEVFDDTPWQRTSNVHTVYDYRIRTKAHYTDGGVEYRRCHSKARYDFIP